MKIKELINKLNQFNPEMEVRITDGCEAISYHTNNPTIVLINDSDDESFVDIGIGFNKI